MAVSAPRWLRSARRRPAAFLAILLLAGGAVLVSAVTPMLLGAVAAATLRERVAAAPFPADGIAVTTVAQSVEDLATAEIAAFEALQPAESSDRWGTPEQVVEPLIVPRLFGPGGRAPLPVHLSLDPEGCRGVRVTGRCPESALEAALPSSSARTTGWRIGTTLTAKVPNPGGVPEYRVLGSLRIVGVYDESVGHGRALADPTRLVQDAAPRSTANVLVGDQGVERFGAPLQVIGGVRLVKPVRQADLPDLRRAAAAADRTTLSENAAQTSASVRTELPALLRAVLQQQSAAAVLVAPVGVEALLLAWFALGAVAQRTARSRAAEWGVGRMRGARIRSWLAFVFSEPTVAVLAGSALGFGSAIALSRLVAAVLLGAPDDVAPFTPIVLGAAGAALGGSLVALVAASVRAALLPLPALLAEAAEPRQQTRVALVGQVAVVSITAATLWAALTTEGFDGQQLGLLLPTMLALVAGLVAVRIAVAVVRRGSRRRPRSLAGLVVGRSLARAPSALVTAQLLLVSSALAACALQLALASAAAQTDRAELATGASRVLTVQAPAGGSLLSVVRSADPGGRVAMAAEQIVGDDESAGDTVLAVDSSRLAAVSTWRRSWRDGVDLRALRPVSGPELRLRGGRLTLVLDDVHTGTADGVPENPGFRIGAQIVVDGPDGWRTIELGAVRPGRLEAAIPCRGGCRVVELTMRDRSPYPQPWSAGFVITAMSTDRQPAGELRPFLRSTAWRDRVVDQSDPAFPATAEGKPKPSGLAVFASDQEGSLTTRLEPAVGPAVVPAILGSSARLVGFPGVRGAVIGTSLADTPTLFHPVATATALPRSLRNGVLVDLASATRLTDPSVSVAAQQVWLAPGDHPVVLARLRSAGVRVLGDERASAAVAAGLRAATNRASVVAGVTALVGILFGLLALIAARTVDMAERRAEWATLRLSGLPDRAVRRLALIQSAVPSVLGALLGVVVGSVAATLIVGRLPLIVGEAPGPLLDGSAPVGALAVLAAAVVVLVTAAAAGVTTAEVGRGRR